MIWAAIRAAVRRLRAVELLQGLLVVSIVGPALLCGLIAWSSYRAAFMDARNELSWTSDVAREHASKVFDSYKLVADRVSDALGSLDDAAIREAAPRLGKQFRGLIAGLPQIESLVVIDRTGHLLVASEETPPGSAPDFSDRDYFQALKSGNAAFVSRVQTSRITGRTFFGWGRSRFDADGSFTGVIDIAISPLFLRNFYQTLLSEVGDSTEGRAVTMVRNDGQVLVRYPDTVAAAVTVEPSNPFFSALRTSPDNGAYTGRSLIPNEGDGRLFAFRKVPGHPIYLVAGRTVAAIRSEWAAGMLRDLAFGLPGAAILFLVILAALRGARREREALGQLRAEMLHRARIEDQLRQAQKMEAVGQLTGGIAHDFNNLLTVIRSSVDLLRRPHLPDDRRARYINAISDTTDRATRLTGQLLAFARRQALQPEVFDVNANVASVIEMMRTLIGPGIAIETSLAAEGLFACADPSQFDTCLVNLAVNARDAMAREGRLKISVEAATVVPPLRARRAVHGEFVAVAISDTGSGIAPERLDAVFEPFFTTKPKGQGTGLGLSQALGFAKQSGGEISVASVVGQGTTFTLYLPRAASPAIASEVEAGDDESAVPTGVCVLVVEDDADVGASTVEVLSGLGYRSMLATNAEQALAELAVDPKAFDVVFSDVQMPGRDGIALGQDIRERFEGLPVVLTSGFSEVLAQDGTHGFDLLRKPYTADQLRRALRKAIAVEQARQRRELVRD